MALAKLGYNVESDSVQDIMFAFDMDRDDRISFDEFVCMLKTMRDGKAKDHNLSGGVFSALNTALAPAQKNGRYGHDQLTDAQVDEYKVSERMEVKK